MVGFLVALGAAACGTGTQVRANLHVRATALALSGTAQRTVERRPLGASVAIVSPAGAGHVPASFTVRVRVHGFRLASGPQRPGGELQFVLDDGRFDEPAYSANGRLALEQAVNGFYSPAYAPVMSYRRIPAGAHVLVVRLASHDGRVLGVAATVHFKVR